MSLLSMICVAILALEWNLSVFPTAFKTIPSSNVWSCGLSCIFFSKVQLCKDWSTSRWYWTWSIWGFFPFNQHTLYRFAGNEPCIISLMYSICVWHRSRLGEINELEICNWFLFRHFSPVNIHVLIHLCRLTTWVCLSRLWEANS